MPDCSGPPTLIDLAGQLNTVSIYSLFPCTSDGFRIEKPDNLDILDAQLEAEKARDTPFDHNADGNGKASMG